MQGSVSLRRILIPGFSFRGLIMDASDSCPDIKFTDFVNREFSFIGGEDGSLHYVCSQEGYCCLQRLGYKPETMFISDTLIGSDFIAGIYMNSDTLTIGEVVILPRYKNLKSEI